MSEGIELDEIVHKWPTGIKVVSLDQFQRMRDNLNERIIELETELNDRRCLDADVLTCAKLAERVDEIGQKSSKAIADFFGVKFT